jgi:hypothetical protein
VAAIWIYVRETGNKGLFWNPEIGGNQICGAIPAPHGLRGGNGGKGQAAENKDENDRCDPHCVLLMCSCHESETEQAGISVADRELFFDRRGFWLMADIATGNGGGL